MTLELDVVRRLAAEIARVESDDLEVVAALTQAGGSGYTEVLLTLRGGSPESCLISVGINRDTSHAALRVALTRGIREHLREHRVGQSGE